MTTVETLKNVYVALGGDADNVADLVLIPDVLGKIAEIIPEVLAALSAKTPDAGTEETH